MNIVSIRLMKDRRREMIPVDKIKVINSRTRDEAQFALNVQSIDAIGQLKDIRVNDKFLAKDGVYELICGEGRLIAQKRNRSHGGIASKSDFGYRCSWHGRTSTATS